MVAKEEEVISRPKVRKLSKKILLVAATEAVDEPTKAIEEAIEKTKAKEKKTTKKPSKKLLIVDSSDDEN